MRLNRETNTYNKELFIATRSGFFKELTLTLLRWLTWHTLPYPRMVWWWNGMVVGGGTLLIYAHKDYGWVSCVPSLETSLQIFYKYLVLDNSKSCHERNI